MIGYYVDGNPNSVERYKGSWILRCRLPGDLPASGNSEALAAHEAWDARGREKFERLQD